MLNMYLFLFVLLVRDYKKENRDPIVVINSCLPTPSTTGSLVSIDSKYETASENLTEPKETKYCQTPPFGNHGNSRSFFKHSYIPSPFPVPSINRILHGPKIIKRDKTCVKFKRENFILNFFLFKCLNVKIFYTVHIQKYGEKLVLFLRLFKKL